MIEKEFRDILDCNDRYKLFVYPIDKKSLNEKLNSFNKIPTINIGKELAFFLDKLEDYKYLNFEVCEFLENLIEKNKTKIFEKNEVLAIYNIGILFETALEINVSQLLLNFSKTVCIILVWEDEIIDSGILRSGSKTNSFQMDFRDINLKKINNVI